MEVLHGRYRLVERLGAGGMSVVWRGYDQILGRQVAVKMLHSGHAEPRHRIRAEAQAAARLNHPHIASVYDYGEVRGTPYVVMELVAGHSLAARLAGDAALPWREAVAVGADVAAALAAAHARGVVHRDVTPANVMLTHAGAKVVDFGISALAGERDGNPDGTLLGTPAYLAPERLAAGEVTPATDVYALGLLLYRCLAGRPPWEATTTTGMLQAHLYTEPAPVPPVEGLPDEVADLVHRCLAKDPTDRPSSVAAARALAAAIGVPAALPQPAPSSAGSPADDDAVTTILPWTTDTIAANDATRRRRAAPVRQAAAIAAGLVALAAGGWLTGALGSEPAADRPAAEAAGQGAAPGAAEPCQVRYAVTGRAAGSRLQLRVTNPGAEPVTVAGHTIPAGAAATLTAADGAALPLARAADGTACTALLDGSGTAPGDDPLTQPAGKPPPAPANGPAAGPAAGSNSGPGSNGGPGSDGGKGKDKVKEDKDNSGKGNSGDG